MIWSALIWIKRMQVLHLPGLVAHSSQNHTNSWGKVKQVQKARPSTQSISTAQIHYITLFKALVLWQGVDIEHTHILTHAIISKFSEARRKKNIHIYIFHTGSDTGLTFTIPTYKCHLRLLITWAWETEKKKEWDRKCACVGWREGACVWTDGER